MKALLTTMFTALVLAGPAAADGLPSDDPPDAPVVIVVGETPSGSPSDAPASDPPTGPFILPSDR